MSSNDFLHHLMRLQFGLSASFHFLFVPLSLGLLLCMNVLQTAHVVTGRSAPARAARFWGRFFLLAWATGLITGYPLRWQLTEVWTHYLQTATPLLKDIFAIEGLIAPFMIGGVFVLTCLRARLPAWVIMAIGWLLLVLLGIQSLTILSINAWMQNPRGISYEAGAWHLSSISQLLLSDTALHKGFHTLSAALLSGAFFLLAISSHFILKRQHLAASNASFKVGAWVGLGAVICVLWSGHLSAAGVSKAQPMKFAAFEGHWKAEPGPAPLVIWAWPDEAHGVNRQELAIPYLMSLLEAGDLSSPPGILDLTRDIERKLQQAWPPRQATTLAQSHRWQIPGLDESLQLPLRDEQRAWLRLRESVAARAGPAWDTMSQQAQISRVAQAARPPVTAVFMAFRVMVGSGMLCLVLCIAIFIKRESLSQGRHRLWLKRLQWMAPLPWLAIISGWAVAEMGRQPWTIHEHLPTFHAGTLPSLENGVFTFVLMLVTGASVATVFAWLARSIMQGGLDAERWLGWRMAQRWAHELVRRASPHQASSPALVRMAIHEQQDMDERHPPRPFENAA